MFLTILPHPLFATQCSKPIQHYSYSITELMSRFEKEGPREQTLDFFDTTVIRGFLIFDTLVIITCVTLCCTPENGMRQSVVDKF